MPDNGLGATFRRAYRFIPGNEDDTIGAFPVVQLQPKDNLDIIFIKDSVGRTIDITNLLNNNDFAMKFLHDHFAGKDFVHDNVTYVSGFPTYEFGENAAGVTLLNPEAIEVESVGKNITGIYGIPVYINHWKELMGALIGVDKYALEKGFVGGFIDCHPRQRKHRFFLFKQGYFQRKTIPKWRLNHLTNFEINLSKSKYISNVRKAHNVVCSIIESCSELSESDKQELKTIYLERIIYHYEGVNDPRNAAEAKVNRNGIYFKPSFLNTGTMHQLSRAVIHEMIHVIGYTHYPTYSTCLPVRSEKCIPNKIRVTGENTNSEIKCGLR
ncbi:hypothetical protein [Wukongibacter baidiensis]